LKLQAIQGATKLETASWSRDSGKLNRGRALQKKEVSILRERQKENRVGGKRLPDKRLGIQMRQFAQTMARFVWKISYSDFRKWL
jgi:hypothetical protein